jgi:hypothetical protein
VPAILWMASLLLVWPQVKQQDQQWRATAPI